VLGFFVGLSTYGLIVLRTIPALTKGASSVPGRVHAPRAGMQFPVAIL
jgi:hypothetical protein